MANPIIETKGLTKRFGDLVAVNNVNLKVREGEIYGLLGPNGAGKSTLIRILTTLSRPTKGTASVSGFDIQDQSERVREQVGLISEKLIMYDRLTAYENLRLFAKLYDVPNDIIEKRIAKLLKVVNMSEWADEQIGKFSTGMKQRINVIRALVSMPRIVFMDEPTLGLDPQSTSEIRQFIMDLNRKEGLTIILTTHIMNEAEVLCDRIGLINEGKIVAEGTPTELRARLSEKGFTIVDLDLKDPPFDAGNRIAALDGVKSAAQKENHVKVIYRKEDAFQEIVEKATGLGLDVRNATMVMPSLEDVFLHYTGRTMKQADKEKIHKKKIKSSHGPRHGFRSKGRIR
jgi:ABC-2 type transport system ATP-binding protein